MGDLGREDESSKTSGSQETAGLPQWQGRAMQCAEGHPLGFPLCQSEQTEQGGWVRWQETRWLVAESPVAEDMRN